MGEAKEKQDKAFADKEARLQRQADEIRASRNDMLAHKRRLEEEAWEAEDRMVKVRAESEEA